MSTFGDREEVFFDTADCFVKGDMMCGDLGYDIWLKEPQSVHERRDNFLCKMGFGDRRVPAAKSEELLTDGVDDSSLSERRKSNSEANCSGDYSDKDWLGDIIRTDDAEEETNESPACGELREMNRACMGKKKAMNWWRHFAQRMKKGQGANTRQILKAGVITQTRVEQSRKRFVECSAVYTVQEVKAHDGLIWTMKFSPDGQYLATGGEDGVVCIWHVTTVDASSKTDKWSFLSTNESNCRKKKSCHPSFVVPERIIHIEEEPLQKLHAHGSDVLDLAWSTSNCLLSSSMDNTVRLWQVGSEKCLGVFHHSNYVTCVQFNPADENCFISGCIDGKVRIWGILSRRVENWANVREIVTAVCYQPNGKGFVTGSVSGTCHFYGFSPDDELLLTAEINIHRRKKSSAHRITGIQFLKNDSRRVLVTSEDSKIRILDGLEVVCKYRGLAKSGSQASASFTSSGRHIISVGDDSRVYLWNHEDDLCIQTTKQVKSLRSCEHFFSEGVTVALPWSGSDMGDQKDDPSSSPSTVPTHGRQESSSRPRDSNRFSLASWFSMDSSTRATTTWPEEKLPEWEYECQLSSSSCGDHLHQQPDKIEGNGSGVIASKTWGLVFVTADRDGVIKAFHNYGLPVRV